MPAEQKTIDATPTWSEVLELLLSSYRSKDNFIHTQAKEELVRMAKIADAYVASTKEKKISG